MESMGLHKVLEEYIKYVEIDMKKKFKDDEEKKQYLLDKLLPFSIFIDRYFTKKGYSKWPPILDMIAPALFNEEYKKRNHK